MQLDHSVRQSGEDFLLSEVKTFQHANNFLVLSLWGPFVHFFQLKQRVFLIVKRFEMKQSFDLDRLLVFGRHWVFLGFFAFLQNIVVFLSEFQNQINLELLDKHAHNTIRQQIPVTSFVQKHLPNGDKGHTVCYLF